MSEIKRDVEFLVFEDKGVVVCKLHNCKYVAIKRIDKYTGGKLVIKMGNVNYRPSNLDYRPSNYYFIDDTFVGVAHCTPEDKFNLEYGKKLALTRAKAKRGRAINKVIEKYVADIQNRLARLIKEGIHKVPDEKEIDEVRKD